MRQSRSGALCALMLLLSLLLTSAPAGAAPAADGLLRSKPEEQGVASAEVAAFVEAADAEVDQMHSFMLVRNGHVVAECYWAPYDAKAPHVLFSLTKSFTSTGVGLAVAEGKLSIDDPVLKFFPDDAPADPSANLKALRVRDLLMMSTGQHAEAQLGPGDVWTKKFLGEPVVHKPGSMFLYNTPATYMLGAIVKQATGTDLHDYLKPRLFEPLGIDDPVWDKSPQGITIGGYGMRLKTEDIARFGQLYLQKGEWRGKQILPASWVALATSRQASNGSNPESDWDQGYGFQFWRCRNNAFRGDGAFGQYCIVIPEQNTVIAITSGVRDMQKTLNLVWKHLLPALKPGTLPADTDGNARLARAMSTLKVRQPQGTASPADAAKVSGKTFTFAQNDQLLESVKVEAGRDGATTLVARFNGKEQRIVCGKGEWVKGKLGFAMFPEQPSAASGAWIAPDTFVAKVCLTETPFALTFTLKFAGDQVTYDGEWNVFFGPTKMPQLVGRAS